MTVMTGKTVREIALENHAATRVFERLGIDYCCGGNKSLEEACGAAKVPVEHVLEAIAGQSQRGTTPDRNWQIEPLFELVAHIKNTHHVYVREEIARLRPLFDKVCSVHGKNHPELFDVQARFGFLAEELTLHLMKEEAVLFPYILRMEESVLEHASVPPAPFGSVANPISMMEHEHDSAGDSLRFMRRSSNGYTAPEDACVSFKTLYQALAEFEADLHQHIHLENNILFPRAVAMERSH